MKSEHKNTNQNLKFMPYHNLVESYLINFLKIVVNGNVTQIQQIKDKILKQKMIPSSYQVIPFNKL